MIQTLCDVIYHDQLVFHCSCYRYTDLTLNQTHERVIAFYQFGQFEIYSILATMISG